MNIVDVVVQLSTKPREFFKGMKKEKSIKHAFLLNLVFVLFYFVIISLFLLLFISLFRALAPAGEKNFPTYILFILMAVWFVLCILFNFVWAGILHVWILIFGGKGDYKQTYQLNVYSSIPYYLLGWFPLIGLLACIYSVYLLIIGTQEAHGIPKMKSILMYVIPICVFMFLIIILYIFLVAIIFSQMPQYMNATNVTNVTG